jgi:hypothetical protein
VTFPLRHRVQTGSGVGPASYSLGAGDRFSKVKQPEREADHSYLPMPRLKLRGAIPVLPQYVIMVW